MAKKNYSYLAWLLFVAVFCSVVFVGTINVSNVFDEKVNEQAKVNYRLTFSEEQWNGLGGVRDNWPLHFKSESESEGSLYKLITTIEIESSGLDVDTSKTPKANTETVIHNGINIGLSKTCITNDGDSFSIEGSSISSLVKSLTILESRKDISFSKAEILNRSGLPVLKMYNFCVLMRV
ncbi:hypothetical protein [Vibrio rotiferianus]|uniref:hypothetical protein n=1 Tax=Vibrio rotiferianus TaxID=190895 RepID=UPI0005F0888A|nr:hypothetical protein [Vibrio rotiferianus]